MRLDEQYRRMLGGDMATLESLWQERLGLMGKNVRVDSFGGPLFGRLRGLSWGSLELENSQGAVQLLPPESVWHVHDAVAKPLLTAAARVIS